MIEAVKVIKLVHIVKELAKTVELWVIQENNVQKDLVK